MLTAILKLSTYWRFVQHHLCHVARRTHRLPLRLAREDASPTTQLVSQPVTATLMQIIHCSYYGQQNTMTRSLKRKKTQILVRYLT